MGQSASLGGRGTPEDRNDGDLCGGNHSNNSPTPSTAARHSGGWGAVEGESIGQAYRRKASCIQVFEDKACLSVKMPP